MNRCHVYKTDKEYIIVTKSKTEDGIWVDDVPISRVPVENKDNKLIESVLEALNNSRITIPNVPIENVPIWQKQTLKKMGQKSYTSLYKKSNSCSVSRDENVIVTISPYKPYTPGNFSSGITVAKEGVVVVDTNVTSIIELESIIIHVLNQDYKS